jgi:hypothetical protein
MADLEAAQQQLREVAGELEAVKFRLLGVLASLPEPAAESTARGLLEDVETMDVRMEIRAVIGCVLNDFVALAIEDLREAAALPSSAPAGGEA